MAATSADTLAAPAELDMTLPTEQADDAVRLEGVGKNYGRLQALHAIDLRIPRGQLFGLIGHNGAGKSTLFKLLLNLITPSAGRIWLDGTELQGRHVREARRHVGYLPENLVLYDSLNGLETMQFFARLKGAPAAQCAPLLERFGLGGAMRRAVREYSKGMRQRLGFAQALLGQPRLLLLDEPTTGLDPQAIRDFYQQLDELRAQGVTLVISSHVLAELQDRVDTIAMLANGRLAAQGSVAALRARSGMPLRVALRAAPALLNALPQTLGALVATAGLHLVPQGPGQWHIHCPRQHKMALLQALAALPLQDLSLHEPSLEDVYFGLREAT